MILVAPSETRSGVIEALDKLGMYPMIDDLTEKHGADYIFPGHGSRICVQRKTVADLIASLADTGRLQREVRLLVEETVGLMIVEGSIEGLSELAAGGRDWDKRSIRNLMRSISDSAVPIERTTDAQDTAERLVELWHYYGKEQHRTLLTRPGMPRPQRSGDPKRDSLLWVLQGLTGVGPDHAEAIVQKYPAPLAWTITVDELAAVERLGPTSAEKIYAVLEASNV